MKIESLKQGGVNDLNLAIFYVQSINVASVFTGDYG